MSIENDVRLIGHLGDDPDTRYTQGGMAITQIRLATTRRFKDRDGNKQEETSWHRVKFFGTSAELAGEYLRKGSQVLVTGRIHYSEYEKDGVKKYGTEIHAEGMKFLDKKPEGQRERSAPAQRQAPQREAPAKSSSFNDDFVDDDIPF